MMGFWVVNVVIAAAALLGVIALQVQRERRVKPYVPRVREEMSAAVPEEVPPLTFLVPAWNASGDLAAFVASYDGLRLARKQLVLCAGGSDGSYVFACKFAREDICVLEQTPGMGKQAALRLSYPHATGEVIYLTDIDCRLEDAVVLDMLAQMQERGLDALTGPIRPLVAQEGDAFVCAQWAVERYLALQSGDTSDGLRGNNAIVTRAAVDASGAFAQETFSGTDYTMAKELIAAGHAIGYDSGAEMRSEYPPTLRIYVRKQARWIRNVFVLGRAYGYVREVRATMVTLAQPIVYVVALCLGFAVPVVWWLALLLWVHSVANRLRYGRVAGIRVTVRGVSQHLLGDLCAAGLVWWQLATRQFTW